MSKRLFIGLELPAPIREELARLDPHIRGVRWVAVEKLHLTMSFLGEVDAAGEERLREMLAAVRVPAFFLPVTGIGTLAATGPGPSGPAWGRGTRICLPCTGACRMPCCARGWSRT